SRFFHPFSQKIQGDLRRSLSHIVVMMESRRQDGGANKFIETTAGRQINDIVNKIKERINKSWFGCVDTDTLKVDLDEITRVLQLETEINPQSQEQLIDTGKIRSKLAEQEKISRQRLERNIQPIPIITFQSLTT